MSNLSMFFKKNKIQKENTSYVATASLLDEGGNPLKWEIKPLSTKESEVIREDCTIEVPVNGKPNVFRQKVLTGKYLSKLIVASVTFPNLNSADLQDSYDVSTPEALLQEIVDDPGEYNAFAMFIQNFNNLNNTIADKVDEVKN